MGIWTEFGKRVGPVSENIPINGLTDPAEAQDAYEDGDGQDRAHRGGKSSRAQTRYWRRVPSVSVLPDERNQIPSSLMLRGGLVVAIVLLVFLTAARYLDWNDSEILAEAAEIRSQSVTHQLAVRQNEIEPLESQITLLSSELNQRLRQV